MSDEIKTIGCSCGCSDEMRAPQSPEEERETLRQQKALIEERLAQLQESQRR